MNMHRRAPGRRRPRPGRPSPAGDGIENRVLLKVDATGRLLIPAEMRASMGLSESGSVLTWLDQGELHVVSTEVAAKQAQRIARRLIGDGARLAEELIADRRAEARREDENG